MIVMDEAIPEEEVEVLHEEEEEEEEEEAIPDEDMLQWSEAMFGFFHEQYVHASSCCHT